MQDGDERPQPADGADRAESAGLAEVVELRPAGPDAPNARPPESADSTRLRTVIGDVLREERHRQERTLADVAKDAAVSLPYLSEVERGRKEVSSDLLHAVCTALDLTLVEVLERSVERLRLRAQGGPGIQMLAA